MFTSQLGAANKILDVASKFVVKAHRRCGFCMWHLALQRARLATLCKNRKPQKIVKNMFLRVFGGTSEKLQKYSKNTPGDQKSVQKYSKNTPGAFLKYFLNIFRGTPKNPQKRIF